MAIVNSFERPYSFELRGKVGRPNEMGGIVCGWSHLGDFAPMAGYYQRRPRPSGQIIVKMRHYWPVNNQHEGQQTWRSVFTDAVTAWQVLSASEKQEWNAKKWPRHMAGYNRFLRNYLKTHA